MKLLIVEDEYMPRNSLYKYLSREEFGFTEIVTAENGEDGIVKFNEFNPDIVISDIVMPKMNGIQMAEHIKSTASVCEILFLSGFSDKEYLRSAIRIGVVNYIDKPVQLGELRDNVFAAIERAKQNKQVLNNAERYQEEELVRLLISNSPIPTDSVLSGYDKYTVMIVRESGKSIDYPLFFEKHNIKLLGNYEQHHRYIGIAAELEGNAELLNDILNELVKETNVTIFIGDTASNVSDVHTSYSNVCDKESLLFFVGNGHIVNEIPKSVWDINKDEVVSKFVDLLENDTLTNAVNYINNLAHKCKMGAYGFDANDVKDLFYNLCQIINRLELEIGLEVVADANDEYLWELILTVETLDELTERLIGAVNNYKEMYNGMMAHSQKVRKAKKYISDNYNNADIAIGDIADSILITPEYLSSLFKAETGMTINQYISQYRIEKAKIILRNETDTLCDIAYKCGFSDSSYFSRKFKKLVGKSPTEYRENHIL